MTEPLNLTEVKKHLKTALDVATAAHTIAQLIAEVERLRTELAARPRVYWVGDPEPACPVNGGSRVWRKVPGSESLWRTKDGLELSWIDLLDEHQPLIEWPDR
jgi:hypothetical protein